MQQGSRLQNKKRHGLDSLGGRSDYVVNCRTKRGTGGRKEGRKEGWKENAAGEQTAEQEEARVGQLRGGG
jgi:hypothetical protein